MGLSKGGSTTKNEQILIGVVGVVCLAAMCYLFIIDPGIKKAKVYSDEIKTMELKLKEVENIDNDIVAKEKELDTLMVKYNEASKGLPKTDRYPELIRDIEKLAVDSGLNAEKGTFYEPKLVEVKAPEAGAAPTEANNNLQGMKYLQVDYYVENDIDKVLTFIDKLEGDDRIADVASVKQTDKAIAVQVFFYVAGGEEKEEYDFN